MVGELFSTLKEFDGAAQLGGFDLVGFTLLLQVFDLLVQILDLLVEGVFGMLHMGVHSIGLKPRIFSQRWAASHNVRGTELRCIQVQVGLAIALGLVTRCEFEFVPPFATHFFFKPRLQGCIVPQRKTNGVQGRAATPRRPQSATRAG